MLPKNLSYGNKVLSAPARSYKSNIQPQNGTGPYNLNDTIIFNIPTRANLVNATTENYLKFNMTYKNGDTTNASTARFDTCGAHGIIKRIRIYHGSNLIEDIDNYGVLAKMMFELQVPTDSTYGKYTVTAGTRNDLKLIPSANNPNALNLADNVYTDINTGVNALLNTAKVLQVNTGADLCTALAATTTCTAKTYCLNLISIMGSLCSNHYFPLFACTSAPLRIEIQLVSSVAQCFAVSNLTNATTDTVQLNNVEFIAEMIELNDASMGIVAGAVGPSSLQFVVPHYKNYQWSNTVNTGGQLNMPIPAKFSSLKALYISLRDQIGVAGYFPYSSVKCTLNEYYFRIGSIVLPPKSPNTTTEFFSELVKSVGSLSDITYQPSIEIDSYSQDASIINTDYGIVSSGSFFIGIDLENYSNAAKDQIFAGYNTNTDDIYLVMKFTTAVATGNVTFDSFALFDEVISFENDTCFVKY